MPDRTSQKRSFVRSPERYKADTKRVVCPVPPSGGICAKTRKLFYYNWFVGFLNAVKDSIYAAVVIVGTAIAVAVAAKSRAGGN
jgi:hypothetical protein